MSKFIKVTQTNGRRIMIPTHEIELIYPDDINGAIVYRKGKKEVLTKESLEQIEAQLLRDEFAKSFVSGSEPSEYHEFKHLASDAYMFADAMLKERMK